MKGFEIKRENEKPIYLFNRFDVVEAIAHCLYYTANPNSKMCIPNCAYEKAEKLFDEWFNDTREMKEIEVSVKESSVSNESKKRRKKIRKILKKYTKK